MAERTEAEDARRQLARAQRQIEIDRRKVERTAGVHVARVKALRLRRRLTAAGISQTRLVRVAKSSISQVGHILTGRSSRRIVAAAEKLAAKGKGSA